jgi:hypothetical protein
MPGKTLMDLLWNCLRKELGPCDCCSDHPQPQGNEANKAGPGTFLKLRVDMTVIRCTGVDTLTPSSFCSPSFYVSGTEGVKTCCFRPPQRGIRR